MVVVSNRSLAVDEQRVRAVIDYALNGVALADGGGICHEANALLTAMTGRPREAIVGRPLTELIHPPDRPHFERWWDSLGPGGPLRAETHLTGPGGVPVPVELKGVPDAVPGKNLLILRDLSEEKRARRLLEESEERYRALTDLTSDYALILRIGPDGGPTVEWLTERTVQDFGNTREQMNEKGIMSFIDPRDLARAEAEFAKLGAMSPVSIDVRAVDRHGEIRWLHGEARPMPDALRDPAPRFVVAIRDITARREAEQRIRRAEARYREVFENAVEGILQTTFDGGIIASNPAAARILGYDSPAELARGVPNMGAIYLDPKQRADLVEVLKTRGEIAGFELRWRRRDGKEVWVSFSGRGLRDDAGELVGIEGFILDVTGRKLAEETLRRSERHFRALIENISDSIVLVGPEGTIEYVSPSGLRTFGFTGGETVGSSAFRWLHPDDRDEAFRLFDEVVRVQGATRSGTFRVTHADGRVRWIEAIATNMLHDPQVRAIVFNSRDITERREAEWQASDRDRRLRMVVEQMPAIMWTTDLGLRVTFAAGAGPADVVDSLVGTSLTEISDNRSEGGAAAVAAHRAALSGEVASYEREWHGRWWRAHVEPLRDADDAIVGAISVASDVTDIKLAQEQVERSVQVLRVMFDERRHLLERLVKVAEEERARVSRELHDELGQLLVSAALFTKAMEERASPELAEPLASLGELLSRAAASTRRLVWSLHPGELEAHGLVPAVRRLGESVGRDQGFRVLVRAEGDFETFPDRAAAATYRIVQEATTNAVRHGRASNVSIVFTRRPGRFSVIVEDDGRGFDPAVVMANPDPTVRMGLVGMQERASAAGCELVIESAPGRGTTVRVEVPEEA